VIVLDLLLSATNSMLELQEKGSMMKIHPRISESCHKFHEFWLELNSGKLGFVLRVLQFLEFVMILI